MWNTGRIILWWSFIWDYAHLEIMLIRLTWSLVSLLESQWTSRSCLLMRVHSSPFPSSRPLSNPSSCQVSVSPQILQVFHQSGQLSVSNPRGEWEKLTELTLWSRITGGYGHCSLPSKLWSPPLLSTEPGPGLSAGQPAQVITRGQKSDAAKLSDRATRWKYRERIHIMAAKTSLFTRLSF